MIDQDVIAVVEDTSGLNGSCVQMFFIRGGKLIGQNHFLVEGTGEEEQGDVVQEFVKQYYQNANYIPQEILLPHEMQESEIIQSWLRQKKGKKVEIFVPARGDKKKLVEMATENATHALAQIKAEMRAKLGNTEAALRELGEALGLPEPPLRIECYDISNTQGENQVASMVVCEKGQMNKQEYRRFKIKRDGRQAQRLRQYARSHHPPPQRKQGGQSALYQNARAHYCRRRARASLLGNGGNGGDGSRPAACRTSKTVSNIYTFRMSLILLYCRVIRRHYI